jgi:hypothetical protein
MVVVVGALVVVVVGVPLGRVVLIRSRILRMLISVV